MPPGQVIFSKRAGPTLGIDAPYGSVATLLFVPGKVITDVEMVTNIDSGGEEPFVDDRPDKTDVESGVSSGAMSMSGGRKLAMLRHSPPNSSAVANPLL